LRNAIDIHADQDEGSDAIGVRRDDKAVAVLCEEIGKCRVRVFTFKRSRLKPPLRAHAGCRAGDAMRDAVEVSRGRPTAILSATLIMTRAHKIFLAMGLAALLAGGSVAIVPPLLSGDRADYSHVVSIKGYARVPDPVLLDKAWALPVAALYRANIDYQRNVSLCGPTSIVNVLRSLHRAGDQ